MYGSPFQTPYSNKTGVDTTGSCTRGVLFKWNPVSKEVDMLEPVTWVFEDGVVFLDKRRNLSDKRYAHKLIADAYESVFAGRNL